MPGEQKLIFPKVDFMVPPLVPNNGERRATRGRKRTIYIWGTDTRVISRPCALFERGPCESVL